MDFKMAQTPSEQLLTELNVKYTAIKEAIDDMPRRITEQIEAAINAHTLDCINKKASGISPKLKEKFINAAVSLMTAVAAVLAMKYGLS